MDSQEVQYKTAWRGWPLQVAYAMLTFDPFVRLQIAFKGITRTAVLFLPSPGSQTYSRVIDTSVSIPASIATLPVPPRNPYPSSSTQTEYVAGKMFVI